MVWKWQNNYIDLQKGKSEKTSFWKVNTEKEYHEEKGGETWFRHMQLLECKWQIASTLTKF